MGTANTNLPGGPNSPLNTVEKTEYVLGLVADDQNLLTDAESDRNNICNVLAGILGTYNCQMSDFPVAFEVSGLNFSVGGTGQKLFVQGRLADNIPTTNFTANMASSSANRTDGLFVQYNQLETGGRTQTVLTAGGSESNMNIPDNYESVIWSYVPGEPGGGVPATPAGFELFATCLVAQNSSTMVPTIVFPTVISQLLTGDVVTRLNNLTGAVRIQGSAAIGVDATSTPGVIRIFLQGGQVVSVNELSGAVTIVGGPGAQVTTSGGQIVVSGAYVFVGEVGISATTVLGEDGVTETTTISGTTINGLSGPVVIQPGPGVGLTISDDTIVLGTLLEAGANITITPGSGEALIIAAAGAEAPPPGPVSAFGTTSGRTGTASITLPDNSHVYNLFIKWDVFADQDTNQIEAASSGISGFVELSGNNGATGAAGAMHYAVAYCEATGTGATINFPLSSGGGTSSGNGLWSILAVPQ